MKKISLLCFVSVILFFLCSCGGTTIRSNTPYVFVEEEAAAEEVLTIDWEQVIAQIPSDEYVSYNGLHAAPLTATLYKNGDCISLDVKDPRLIRLWNFYNNEIYYGVYSYSQGPCSSLYEDYKDAAFRLELTFTPATENITFETSFDKFVISDGHFFAIQTDTPTPFQEYDYSVFSRYPLHVYSLHWLEIFGL